MGSLAAATTLGDSQCVWDKLTNDALLKFRAAQRTGKRTPYEHPNALTLKVGSRALGVPAADTRAGLRLLKWAELDRYALAPPPLSLQEAIGWAKRVKAFYIMRRNKAKV